MVGSDMIDIVIEIRDKMDQGKYTRGKDISIGLLVLFSVSFLVRMFYLWAFFNGTARRS